MDKIAQLETVFETLLERVDALESENVRLREQLESEREGKQEIQTRVEQLLQRVQERIG